MSNTETWTVGRLLGWTAEYLKSRGADNPRLDAEVLLGHALGCERIMLYARFAEEVADEARSRFRGYVKQRADGAPVAYVVGHKEFFSRDFLVSPAVLIPRPETEHAVIAALDALKAWKAGPPLVADVGTGSGAIAVTIACQAPAARVVALDISPAALAIALENATRHQAAERMQFLCGNLLEPLPPVASLAVVVANLPYVSEPEYAELHAVVRDHEPRLALVGGEQGTELIARLIPQAAERLLPGGELILELSPMIASAVAELVARDGHFSEPRIIRDLAGHNRIVQAQRKS